MLPAVINAFRTLVTLITAEIIWIDTNWSSGQAVIVFAAIIIMFSPLAEKAYPTAAKFALGAALTAVLAAIVRFVVLPAVHSFVGLILVLAVVLVPFGALSAGRWQKVVFTAAVVLFMPLLAIENQPTYDLEAFFNSALAIVTGVALAMVFLRLVPPMGPAWRTERQLNEHAPGARHAEIFRSRDLFSVRKSGRHGQALYVRLAELELAIDGVLEGLHIRSRRLDISEHVLHLIEELDAALFVRIEPGKLALQRRASFFNSLLLEGLDCSGREWQQHRPVRALAP